MIKTVLRGLAAAALVVLPLAAAPPTHAAETVLLATAIDRLPLGTESREGYQRTSFKHWNPGINPTNGCNTRAEVLIWEAVEAPETHPGCQLDGGRWWSYYDATWVTAASGLDIDQMVPLAEAWDSGASAWTTQRREAYANDQAAETSLVAVTARSNRSKSDKDPADWLPPALTAPDGPGSPDRGCESGRLGPCRFRQRGTDPRPMYPAPVGAFRSSWVVAAGGGAPPSGRIVRSPVWALEHD
ncbi:HNH endonuclease family protein [Streptomyces phaeochromogenes]|nr:HNH endonuclease family protein [Streptomyces phaeochromogenes]